MHDDRIAVLPTRLMTESSPIQADPTPSSMPRTLESAVLRWTGDKPRTGLQEAARDARYRLLREACRERGIRVTNTPDVLTKDVADLGVAMMLVAAATWAIGTQLMRRTRINAPTLAISFWMTVATTLWMSTLALLFERGQWLAPNPAQWAAIAYNAVGVFAFAQVAWLVLARELPPIASTLSVMFIPVLGVFSGAWWLGEVLHWQDWTAVVLVMLAIATVLWPTRPVSAEHR